MNEVLLLSFYISNESSKRFCPVYRYTWIPTTSSGQPSSNILRCDWFFSSFSQMLNYIWIQFAISAGPQEQLNCRSRLQPTKQGKWKFDQNAHTGTSTILLETPNHNSTSYESGQAYEKNNNYTAKFFFIFSHIRVYSANLIFRYSVSTYPENWSRRPGKYFSRKRKEMAPSDNKDTILPRNSYGNPKASGPFLYGLGDDRENHYPGNCNTAKGKRLSSPAPPFSYPAPRRPSRVRHL